MNMLLHTLNILLDHVFLSNIIHCYIMFSCIDNTLLHHVHMYSIIHYYIMFSCIDNTLLHHVHMYISLCTM